MRLRIKGFSLSVTYPALCLLSLLIIFDLDYLYCILAVILHEAGHIIAMILLKANVSGLKISAFDIRIKENSRHFLSFKRDIFVTAAGPFVNLLMFSALVAINVSFALVNLFIGLFNLLPAAGLDGGQLIYLILSRRFSREKSSLILDIITVITSIPLFLSGILVVLNSPFNFSLLIISIYLILSLFIKEDRYL